jgi:tetratricopeptide (TPR) repeat protein
LAGGVLLAMLVAAFVALELWRDEVYGEPAPVESVLYVRSGGVLKRMSLSYSALLADVYWVRSVQYYGSTRLSRSKNKNYDLLYPLLDMTTSLDPGFNIAYRFGAIFLAEPYPGGAGRTDLAIALLEKGFRANPGRWQYLQDIGFVHYWWIGDYEQAAGYFQRAAGVPGSPWWLQSLAAVTYSQGGDRQTSRRLWQSLRDTAGDDWIRNNAVLRLAQLDALDAIDVLDALVRQHRLLAGSSLASWAAMVQAGALRGVPLDPAGVPYELDPGSGLVTVSRESPLYPLPAGRQAALPRR